MKINCIEQNYYNFEQLVAAYTVIHPLEEAVFWPNLSICLPQEFVLNCLASVNFLVISPLRCVAKKCTI